MIEKIKAEIERLIEESDFDESAGLYSLLSFLSTLEKECQWSTEDDTKIAYICDVMSGKELVSDISPSYRSEIIEFAKSLQYIKVKSEKQKFSKEFDDYFLQKNREQKGRWGFSEIYNLARHFAEWGAKRVNCECLNPDKK